MGGWSRLWGVFEERLGGFTSTQGHAHTQLEVDSTSLTGWRHSRLKCLHARLE